MSDGDDSPSSDGRIHQRFPVDWRVTLKLPDWTHASRVAAQNASRGGLFVLTSRPPEVGTVVELTIELPDGGKLDVTGTVQHVVTPERAVVSGLSPGIGVRIDDKHHVDILLLEQMAAAAATRTPAPAPPAWEEPAPATSPPSPRTVGRIQLVAGQAARVVGVDFGTSFTRLACLIGERPQLAADADGRSAHASAVSYPPGAAPLCGWAARARMGVDPHRTILEARRLLGRKLDEPGVHGLVAAAPFRVIAAPDGGAAVDLGDRVVTIAEVVTTLLAHVREQGERHFRRPIREAVFSVASDAGEEARAALRAVATAAGFEVAGLLDEPIAAALAAGPRGEDGALVVVADWGGGGFALSVLEVTGERARVIAREHDPHLGAGELAAVVADLAADAFWRETKLELRQAVIPWQRLLLQAEDAVRTLATEERALLAVPRIALAPDPVDLRQEITAAELEAGAAGLVTRALEVCGAALARCGVSRDRLARVVATGGAARFPFVRGALAAYFERDVDALTPEEAVACGAARRGASVIRVAS